MRDCVEASHEKCTVRGNVRPSVEENERVLEAEAEVVSLRVEAFEGQRPQRLPFTNCVASGVGDRAQPARWIQTGVGVYFDDL